MKKTEFDCVEMKRHGAEAIEKKTKNMTGEQEYEFWKEQTRNLKQFQELQQQQGKVPIPMHNIPRSLKHKTKAIE